jgi:hypothetical protein
MMIATTRRMMIALTRRIKVSQNGRRFKIFSQYPGWVAANIDPIREVTGTCSFVARSA